MKISTIDNPSASTKLKGQSKISALSSPVKDSLLKISSPIAFYGLFSEDKNESLNKNTGKIQKYFRNLVEKFKILNLEKLNEPQKGIKVFEGLSMREIEYIFTNLESILTYRGCHNKCSHCFADAKPHHVKNNPETINQMLWDDFSDLSDGIEKLQKKLGNKALLRHNIWDGVIAPFWDADCTEIEMRDVKGKIYDFSDINDLMSEKMHNLGLFDTTGWTPWDKKLQKRAEKLVRYFSVDANYQKMDEINISINPCHGLNQRAIELKNQGKIDAASKFRNYYTDRIANAIFTFTPILNKSKFNLFVKYIPNKKANYSDYNYTATKLLVKEIGDKVIELYKKDFKGAKKYIKTEYQLNNITEILMHKMKRTYNEISDIGRAKNIMKKTWKHIPDYSKRMSKNYSQRKLIDANGKIHIVEDEYTMSTELQFNFRNKNKKAPPIGEVLDLVLTKDMIKKMVKTI